MVLGEKGQNTFELDPGFIGLLHEVILAHHPAREVAFQSYQKPTISLTFTSKPEVGFTDLEEQITITGLKNPIVFIEPQGCVIEIDESLFNTIICKFPIYMMK